MSLRAKHISFQLNLSQSGGEKKQTDIRWPVIWFGISLIPLNNYWVFASLRWDQGYPTTMSLFFNAIFTLAVLVALNLVITRFSPSYALTRGELLLLYTMLSVASAICGHDLFEVIVTNIATVGWLASEENEWAVLFHQYLPDWLALTDKHRLTVYFTGESNFYLPQHLQFWWRPVLAWSGFIVLLLFTAFCINLILRKQWIENERLSYPIIELPYRMTSSGFFQNRWLWIGIILAGGMDFVNGLHFLYPSLPGFGGEFYDLHPLFTTKPWNAIGWTPVVIFPFAIGLAYFMPLDLAFTFWFFYLFWKFEMILGNMSGLHYIAGFPFIFEQSFGVCVGVLLMTLWRGRRHLREVVALAWQGQRPNTYRLSTLGLIAGLCLLVGFWWAAGMSLWVAVLTIAIHLTIITVITRIRAELGPPIHDLRSMGPDVLLPKIFGMRTLGARNLSLFSLVFCFNRAYRGNAMPHQLEGLKLAERSDASSRRFSIAIILTIFISPLVAFWVALHIGYQSGAIEVWSGSVFNRTQSWLNNPMPVDLATIVAMIVGLVFSFLIALVRLRFVWWPLYPVGYAISGTWAVNFFWFSVLISYFIKLVILRFSGLKAYRRAAPFFLGLVLGEFLVGSLWGLVGICLQKPMYRFIW